MSETDIFPTYVDRREEERVVDAASRVVSGSGDSRVLLLYGDGGTGKTQLIRHLAHVKPLSPVLHWVEPIDMDDPEFWLLSNLEMLIAADLDPRAAFFGPYYKDLLELPHQMGELTPIDMVLGYLRRVKRTFVECYKQYVETTGEVPVIALDTIEVIRGTHLLLTLTQWIKALPRTLFILSSRPDVEYGGGQNRIKQELEDPHQRVTVDELHLAGFSRSSAIKYLTSSAVDEALEYDDRERLVHLTRGHPLWLALAVEYLRDVGLPEEVQELTVEEIQSILPLGAPTSLQGTTLLDSVKRRLLTPYKATDFWHESVKRMAVVRQSLDFTAWRELMDDRDPPEAMTWEAAWNQLRSIPWVRTRANGRQVTLHDVLSEELAWRVIPLGDQDGTWRHSLWLKAREIFAASGTGDSESPDYISSLDERLGAGRSQSDDEAGLLIQEVSRLDVRRRSESQAKAAELHYTILSDFASGSRLFVSEFDSASKRNDVFLQELLVLEVQRFLPPEAGTRVTAGVFDGSAAYQEWLVHEGRSEFLEVGLRVGAFLTATGQAVDALTLLASLPAQAAQPDQRYRLENRLGNACMGVPARVADAETHFKNALELCMDLQTTEQARRKTEAHKELGFYFRNVGQWERADQAYRDAVAAMPYGIPTRGEAFEREEIASVYTNWAYVRALSGGYREAQGLVEAALKIRRGLGRELGLAISLSVYGEILRYDRKFHSAWRAYEEARTIFESQGSWHWLGLVFQEEAICLFQAAKADFPLPVEDPLTESRRRVIWALDLCRDQNLRAYPSALNRAGRILGDGDPSVGLMYLSEGIEQARKLADGWFYCANLVEYAELRYRRWSGEGSIGDLAAIRNLEEEIEAAVSKYPFPDLQGRWLLLKGYLAVEESLEGSGVPRWSDAVQLVTKGFRLIAQSLVGSHGAAALPYEFARLQSVIERVPPEIRDEWYGDLRADWGDAVSGDATLLARLQELYVELG